MGGLGKFYLFLAAFAVVAMMAGGVMAFHDPVVYVSPNVSLEGDGNNYILYVDNSVGVADTSIINETIDVSPFIVTDCSCDYGGCVCSRTTSVISWTGGGCYINNATSNMHFHFKAMAPMVTLNTTYVWSVTTADLLGFVNTETVNFFVINDEVNPASVSVSPAENSTSDASMVNFNCTATDNLALANISLYLNGAFSQKTSVSGKYNETLFIGNLTPDGTYTWRCEACDTSGNCGDSITRALKVDTTFPVLSMVSPINGITYNSNDVPVQLSYTASDIFPDKCWYYVNGTTYNIACDNSTHPVALPDGSHTLTLYANDSAGHTSTQSVTFDIDQTLPYMASLGVSGGFNGYFSPANSDGLFDAAAIIALFSEASAYEIIVQDPAGDRVFDWTGAGANASAVWDGTYESSGLYVPDGVYALNITMTDGTGNRNESSTTAAFRIDNTRPVLAFVSPPGNTENNGNSVAVALNVSHNESGSGPGTLVISVDGIVLYNGSYVSGGFTSATYTAGLGTHNYMAWSNDSVGNQRNVTGSFTFSHPPPPVPNAPGGFSSAGGCSWAWNCTEWSGCDTNGNQTRACRNVGSCADQFMPPQTKKVCTDVPTCSDGVRNQGEAGLDCGGPNCAHCRYCSSPSECGEGYGCIMSGSTGQCVPTMMPESCGDGEKNNGETGVDCGGPCDPCSSCGDGEKNNGETGVDCGGPCGACAGTAGGPSITGMVIFTPQNAAAAAAVLIIGVAAGLYFLRLRIKTDRASIISN